MKLIKLIREWIETFYIKHDKEMYDAIKNTNRDSEFIAENELRW